MGISILDDSKNIYMYIIDHELDQVLEDKSNNGHTNDITPLNHKKPSACYTVNHYP